MGKRRAARQAAVQFHFWRDLHGDGAPERMDEFWEFCPATPRVRDVRPTAHRRDDRPFAGDR